jgi:hypothetical protein
MNHDRKGVFGSQSRRLTLAVMIACALGGASSAAAAPLPDAAARVSSSTALFVYTANHGRNDVSQFAAPLASHEALQPLTPPTVAAGTFPIAIVVSPEGNSAYVVNTDANTISQYRIDPSTGKLTPLSPATVPANGPGAEAIIGSFLLAAQTVNPA